MPRAHSSSFPMTSPPPATCFLSNVPPLPRIRLWPLPRKFIVCDVRRFEEHYPYTALPDRSLLRHLLRPEPLTRSTPDPSPSSPSLFSPQQDQPCPGPIDAGGGNGGRSDEASDGGEFQTTGMSLCPSATTTTPPLPSGAPIKQQQQQQPALSVREEGSAASASAAVSLKRQPEPEPGSSSCSSSSPASQSPLGHVYEIIREGCPCRMYFDLEFARGYNPGLDGEELVRAWINVVAGKGCCGLISPANVCGVMYLGCRYRESASKSH